MRIVERKAKVWYLRKLSPFEYINNESNLIFNKFDGKDINKYLDLYAKIGAPWQWSNRLLISKNELIKILENRENQVYFVYDSNVEIGMVEVKIEDKNMEVVYLGLAKEYNGKGLGKALMNKVFEIANQENTKSIWLHTCEFDSPAALKFYQNCGFEVYDEKEELERHIIK